MQGDSPGYQPHGAIRLPRCWDHDKDDADFLARFGPIERLGERRRDEFIQDKIVEAYAVFNAVLDGAVGYFGFGPRWRVRAALSSEEKIEGVLASLVARRLHREGSYRKLLEERLAECAHMDHERGRILREHLRAAAAIWFFPLCEVADGLVSCAIGLETSLLCEGCGYSGTLVFHDLTRVPGARST